MRTETQIRAEIRAAREKLRSMKHGTPERDRFWAHYCALQDELGRLELAKVPEKRAR